jgi:uncharacterized protein YoxC
MWKLTKKYWKDVWNLMWSKTTIDEKAVEAAKEVKRRVKNVKEELKDVSKAVKEVGNQIGDVGDAVAGEKRKGRKTGKQFHQKK